MSLTPPEEIIEFASDDPTNTEMALGDVRLPGVYEISQTGKGMTGKYLAEKTQGESNPYTDTQDDEADDDFARGTLLNQDGEPYINADTEQRIRIGEDEINGETYAEPAEDYATIRDDDPSTPDQNEAGWVVGPDGERVSVVVETDDGESETRPLQLSPDGGYTVHPGTTDEESDDEETDETDESDDSGEESGAEGDGEGPPGSPRSGQQTPGVTGMNPEGYDSIRPPPIEVTVKAYCTDETWEALQELRDHERPFDMAVGEFSIPNVGVLDLSRNLAGELYAANDVTVKLKQFEEVTVVESIRPLVQAQSTGSVGSEGGAGPVKGWIDQNNDGIDDRSQQPIPEYEEITVGAGETYQATVDGGELWGNKYIDVSAAGASAKIDASGSGWVIKNVGIEGGLTADDSVSEGFGHSTIAVGGAGVIENVYLGDGAESTANRVNGIYVRDVSGEIAINRVNVQGMGTNGIYASAPSSGTVDVTNVYSAHNNVANLRLNGTGQADSVVLNTDGSGASTTTGTNRRGLWVWDGTVTVSNSEIRNTTQHAAIASANGGQAVLENTNVEGSTQNVSGDTGGSPQIHHPAGVPDSASMAAEGRTPTGGRAGDGSSGGGQALAYANFENSTLPSALTSASNTSNASRANVSYEGSSSLEITFPSGSHFGLAGEYNPAAAGDGSFTELAATYWLRFSDGFQVDSNVSKLPGPLDAVRGAPTAGNPSNGSNGWSMRLGFTSGSGNSIALGYYAYYVGQNASYGEFLNGSGASVQPGEWVKIGQYIRLNSSAGANDGRAVLRINGVPTVDRSNMEYTNSPSDGISYRFAAYYGGNAPSPQTQSVFIDDWSVSGR